jgi:putative flippase GtrA
MTSVVRIPLMWRYIANGIVAGSVHYSVLHLLIENGHVSSAGLANGCAAVFGITASYCGAHFLVFKSASPITLTLPRFLFLYAVIAGLHTFALYIWTDTWRLSYTTGFFIATVASVGLNFLGNRFIVFSTPAQPR